MTKTDKAVVLIGSIAASLGAIQTGTTGLDIAVGTPVLQWVGFGCGLASGALFAGLAYYRNQVGSKP